MANEQFQLVVRKGPQPGDIILLELDVITMGRDPISDIPLEDAEVSRHHAKMTLRDGGYELQDLGSTNGTFVDGKRLEGEPVLLSPGQVIMLGSNVTLVFQATPEPEADPLATMVAPVAIVMPEESIDETSLEPASEEVPLPDFEEESVEASLEASPVPSFEEEDETATMMEETPFPEEQPAEPEPLPSFEEPLSEPELEELPSYEAPDALPSFEAPEPEVESPTTLDIDAPLADELEGQTMVDSGEPFPDFETKPADAPPPEKPATVIDANGSSDRNRNIIIAVVVVLLLCCCCLIILGALFATTDVFQDLAANSVRALAANVSTIWIN